ncbi:MAG: hypothetical protein IPM54_44005 [Polyangiaceae bacterium]|nr:hypothetical protein [Polyangiaceae bacterium]
MNLSVCRKFRKGDNHWCEHIEHYRVSYLSEIRSIDGLLNWYAPDYSRDKLTPETLDEALAELPIPDPDNDYYMLGIDLVAEPEYVARLPEGWKLMGHDLADGTRVSSLHNCGRWEGQLEPLTRRLNEFGLLSLADAELARKLLPLEWGEHDHHAHVTIWALYTRECRWRKADPAQDDQHTSPMFLSVRRKLLKGWEGWYGRIQPFEDPPSPEVHFSEVRSIDSLLNCYTSDHGPVECTPESLDQALAALPTPRPYPYNEYYLLAIDLLAKPEYAARLPAGWKLLGHDLADENRTSSLHAYLRWEGQLEPLTKRLNEFGLLSLADAELARKLLPRQWGQHDPHAHVTIWALYERE